MGECSREAEGCQCWTQVQARILVATDTSEFDQRPIPDTPNETGRQHWPPPGVPLGVDPRALVVLAEAAAAIYKNVLVTLRAMNFTNKPQYLCNN